MSPNSSAERLINGMALNHTPSPSTAGVAREEKKATLTTLKLGAVAT